MFYNEKGYMMIKFRKHSVYRPFLKINYTHVYLFFYPMVNRINKLIVEYLSFPLFFIEHV